MTTARDHRSALVFGASGFVGRWLVKELLDQGVPTTAAMRSIASARVLTSWLEVRNVVSAGLQLRFIDLSVDGLDIGTDTLPRPSEVYNLAGAYAFGMSPHEARGANVEAARRVVEFPEISGSRLRRPLDTACGQLWARRRRLSSGGVNKAGRP